MTILVGYLPDKGGRAALDLATRIARSGTPEPIAVATVVPQAWSTPSMAKIDHEFAEWAQEVGQKAQDRAQEYLRTTAPDVPVTFHRVAGRSIPKALQDAAEQTRSELIVLGSSADGPSDRIVVGSTAHPLLHSSSVPIALAPRGYRSPPPGTVGRITCSFAGGEDDEEVLTATALWAKRLDVPLRIATFGVRGSTMYPSEVGYRVEDQILDQWRAATEQAQQDATERLCAEGMLPERVTHEVGTGGGWTEALEAVDWDPGEVLVVGSSRIGPIRRVFLGSRAVKIVRHSPVPVIVVPDADIAQEVLGAGPRLD